MIARGLEVHHTAAFVGVFVLAYAASHERS